LKKLLFLIVLVGACSNDNYVGDEYVARLENVLEVELPKTSVDVAAFPSARALQQFVPSNELSIREFFSLRECELHTILARRNSQMGKVAVPSQRLFNDLEILAAGPDCLVKLSDQALATKLHSFLNTKRASIGNSLWKAILGEQENRSFWRTRTDQNYPATLAVDTQPTLIALHQFVQRVKNGEYEFSKSEITAIEEHLGQLRFGDGGQLLAEYARLVQTLTNADKLIAERLQHPLCLQRKTTSKAKYFQNVVLNHFIQGVQTYAVALNQREAQLMPTYLTLEDSLIEFSPETYKAWRTQRERLILDGKQALKKHALVVSKLFSQCALTVGKPVS